MLIKELEVLDFRNHEHTKIEWGAGINLITGANGAGKTSLIDAIHYLCMSRSFVANTDQYVMRQGASFFKIDGWFSGQIRAHFKVSCNYARKEGKRIFVNDSPLDRLADLIGMVPVVVLSPEDKLLTSDGPAVRRTFIDGFISQLSKTYLNHLMAYRKIIKQRNKLLQFAQGQHFMIEASLEAWDAQLVDVGSKIAFKRAEVLKTFENYLADQYQKMAGIPLKPSLKYQSFFKEGSTLEEIQQQYYKLLEEKRQKELDREQCMVGPHRDEIVFYLGDMEIRRFGSQGQHRLFAVALKLAQLFYYSDELDDLPIFLLDDVFGDLDPDKIHILFELLKAHPGQSFVTAANDVLFNEVDALNTDKNRSFVVRNGLIEQKIA